MSNDKNKLNNIAGIARSGAGADEPLPFEPIGVTKAEADAAGRLLASIADEQDAQVDYAGMLRRIKAQAMEQGLAAAAAKKPEDKQRRMRRILRIAGSVAAAFAVGLAVLSVIKAVNRDPGAPGDNDGHGHQAFVDNTQQAEAPATEDIKTATEVYIEPTAVPTENVIRPAATEHSNYTEPVTTEDPAVSNTPLPSEFPVRGGVRGYTYVKGFETPTDNLELVPPAMPDFMKVEYALDGLGYTASGKDEDGAARYITCWVVDAGEDDLPEGVAIYTLYDDGRVGYIWRISEESLMYVDFEGFEYSEAEILLLSYAMPDIMES